MSDNITMIFPELLTATAFSEFGEVIELDGHDPVLINSGNCHRYSDLASLDIASCGRPGVSLFDAKAYTNPLLLTYVERHPLGSQAFLPTSNEPYLVVVASDRNNVPQRPKAFITQGYQGVNYHRNIWHGVLTPVKSRSLFVVVDYIGEGDNLQEFHFDTPYKVDFSGV
jgi:ureidoglycolate lyase